VRIGAVFHSSVLLGAPARHRHLDDEIHVRRSDGGTAGQEKAVSGARFDQTSVLLLNPVMIATVMWPSTQGQVMAAFPDVFGKWYFATPSIHAMLGIAAEILGLYVALSAGTRLCRRDFVFKNGSAGCERS